MPDDTVHISVPAREVMARLADLMDDENRVTPAKLAAEARRYDRITELMKLKAKREPTS